MPTSTAASFLRLNDRLIEAERLLVAVLEAQRAILTAPAGDIGAAVLARNIVIAEIDMYLQGLKS